VTRQTTPVGKRIFNCDMISGPIVGEDEVIPDELIDGRLPLHLTVVLVIVDEERECRGREGFGRAARVEQSAWCHRCIGEFGIAETLEVILSLGEYWEVERLTLLVMPSGVTTAIEIPGTRQ